MRLPSQRMPAPSSQVLGFPGWLALAALILVFGYFIYSSSNLGRCVTAALILTFCVYTVLDHRRERRRLALLAESRPGESICEFARSFDPRTVDTWVIRAAHQEIQKLLQPYVSSFPVRASDSLLRDLHIDTEDVEDLIIDIAKRSGHSIEKTEDNPYYGSVHSVSDLVHFVCAQPSRI